MAKSEDIPRGELVDAENMGDDKDQKGYLAGWRLTSLSILLVNIEVSVVATSLLTIVNNLKGYDKVGWVVTAYLVTYTSLIIIWSKFSNLLGRKSCIVSAVIIFMAFSGACGGASSMIELIVFRALQGIGAAGCLSMSLTIAYEMVPQDKYPKYAAIFSAVSALGSLSGPLIGGAFAEKSSWRWVFLVPVGAAIILLLTISIPNRFPHHAKPQVAFKGLSPFAKSILTELDLTGASCLLGASLLLVLALLEGGVAFKWRSAPEISILVISGLLWILFLLNERIVSKRNGAREAIFPWHYLFNRAWMGTLLVALLSGVPYIVTIIDLPARFQTVADVSPFGAGVRLIPFNLLIAVGSVLVNVIAAKTRVPAIALLSVGSILQMVGVSLTSSIDNATSVPSAIYGYQVITGLGIGFIFGLCLVLPPMVIKNQDTALCAGAVMQFRVFGSALDLAVASTVFNNYITSHLRGIVTEEQLHLLLRSTEFVADLPQPMRLKVVGVLVRGYNARMRTMIGFSAAQFIAILMLWQRSQIYIMNKPVVEEGQVEVVPAEHLSQEGEKRASKESMKTST
ncbi:major facilitator superfamily domain-containing protein [Clohesyomyces aquaticus]|uniref:Major facilitator superfamily domain-containing protein n=1 Tax=Clohesyomyces aquaticus TaxID=1231657 RepID=A0A1Y1Z621_9PLEO|nr:major facilitator superfamily domain-containing protein [Clohesyomyces aquaticus]